MHKSHWGFSIVLWQRNIIAFASIWNGKFERNIKFTFRETKRCKVQSHQLRTDHPVQRDINTSVALHHFCHCWYRSRWQISRPIFHNPIQPPPLPPPPPPPPLLPVTPPVGRHTVWLAWRWLWCDSRRRCHCVWSLVEQEFSQWRGFIWLWRGRRYCLLTIAL